MCSKYQKMQGVFKCKTTYCHVTKQGWVIIVQGDQNPVMGKLLLEVWCRVSTEENSNVPLVEWGPRG